MPDDPNINKYGVSHADWDERNRSQTMRDVHGR